MDGYEKQSMRIYFVTLQILNPRKRMEFYNFKNFFYVKIYENI